MQQRCAASPYIRNGNSVQTVTSNKTEAIDTTNKAYLAAIKAYLAASLVGVFLFLDS
jgi:pyruvate/2-oxoacid:ferredoxin oxidoreductase alpha subunit